MTRKKWRELSATQRKTIVALAAIQFELAAWAWWDLAKRPSEQVQGSKRLWAFVIAVNFVGPLCYLRWGRTRPRATTTGQSA